MSEHGYESWFVSARDPASARALWIRHTRHCPRAGQQTAALWCVVTDRTVGERPLVVKQVFRAFPATSVAGPRQFCGSIGMADRRVSWDLEVASEQVPLLPLRPAVLNRAPVPRTKVEVSVPDGVVTGALEVDGGHIAVSGWRGTVGHNWGSEHADTWVWLHAADFEGAPECWLDLVLARIRVGLARSPWMAMGALALGGKRIPLGGLGRRSRVNARPDRLLTQVRSAAGLVRLRVSADGADVVAVPYADPSGGRRTVTHAALASVELRLGRLRGPGRALAGGRGAYEFGSSEPVAGVETEPLPEG